MKTPPHLFVIACPHFLSSFSISSFESTTRRLSPPQTPLSFRTKSEISVASSCTVALFASPEHWSRTARTSKTLSNLLNTPPRRSFSTPPTRFLVSTPLFLIYVRSERLLCRRDLFAQNLQRLFVRLFRRFSKASATPIAGPRQFAENVHQGDENNLVDFLSTSDAVGGLYVSFCSSALNRKLPCIGNLDYINKQREQRRVCQSEMAISFQDSCRR